jgi:hypothetical protein
MKKRIALFIILLAIQALMFPAFAQSMWTVQEMAEIDGFSELDGILVLKFKDAVTGAAIRDLSVIVAGEMYEGDFRGMVELPIELVEGVDDEDLPFIASAPGYIDLEDVLKIRLESVMVKRFLMTKGLKFNQARFVLEWDQRPVDLDAHLLGPGFHISYRNMRSVPGKAILDRDARQGFGPETITLEEIVKDATYTLTVDNYSNESPMRNVKVSVYMDNRLHKVLFYPEIRQNSLTVLTISEGRIFYTER